MVVDDMVVLRNYGRRIFSRCTTSKLLLTRFRIPRRLSEKFAKIEGSTPKAPGSLGN
jgi:hypothetical protein